MLSLDQSGGEMHCEKELQIAKCRAELFESLFRRLLHRVRLVFLFFKRPNLHTSGSNAKDQDASAGDLFVQ